MHKLPTENLYFNMKKMKKLSLYIFLVLMFCNVGFADDISEYEIEGISIGDSLLDHMSKEEIITEIERTRPAYNHLNNDFGEVYLYGNFVIINGNGRYPNYKATLSIMY